jgi:hypothetical protein
MKVRFTIRDLLWLMLVVAVAFGVNAYWSRRERETIGRLRVTEREYLELCELWDQASDFMSRNGIDWPPADDTGE